MNNEQQKDDPPIKCPMKFYAKGQENTSFFVYSHLNTCIKIFARNRDTVCTKAILEQTIDATQTFHIKCH